MAYVYKQVKYKFFELLPLLLLFFISLSGNSILDLKFFSVNIHYILVYFWVLRKPRILGYGFIFLSGIVNDAVVGLPIGVSSVTYLILAGFAAYIRYLTVQPSMVSDWIVFIPAIAVTNSVYFYILRIFFDINVNYISLLLNTGITILLYPVFSILFSFLANKIMKERNV